MNLKAMRIKAGLHQVDLTSALGVKTPAAVSQYETGKRKLKAEQLPALAAALGCTIDELFEKEESPA